MIVGGSRRMDAELDARMNALDASFASLFVMEFAPLSSPLFMQIQ